MNNKVNLLILACLIMFGKQLSSQKKYWVTFTNKNGTPYTVGNPSAFLSQRSIDRRVAFNIPVVQNDLPVTPAYVSQILSVPNVTLHYVSKWMNGVVISTNSQAALTSIKSFTFVLDTAKVSRYKLDYMNGTALKPYASPAQTNLTQGSAAYNYGGSYWQNKQINVDCLHSLGFTGYGMCIAVLDAGFYQVDSNPLFDSIRANGYILGTRDFVSGGTNVYDDDSHGTSVFSCMAANKPGVIVGSAPHASYWLLRTEQASSETLTEEYNWIRGAEFADSVGAHILTTSLGYTQFDNAAQNHNYSVLNGRTAPMSIAANLAARKGMFVLNAAGNEGASSWQYISVPADADSICTVGAIDSLGAVAAFSSIGPTYDGRIKPDLVARGVGTWVSFFNGQVGPGNGTSFATPVLAGAVACYWQAHRSFSNIKVLDTLRHTASNSASPNNSMGWGIPNMCAIPVGINETLALSAHLRVFPNPFQTILKIEITDPQITVGLIEVIDISGKLLFSEKVAGQNKAYQLDLSQFSKGLYFIKVSTSSGTLTQKIIKSE